MIYKENTILDYLNKYTYLTEDESKININTIPIVENSRLDSNIVDFDYIEYISKQYGLALDESISIIKKNNFLDNLTVSINDYKLIESPELITVFDNLVVKPLSENDIVSKYCGYICEEYLNTQDESVFDNILDENKLTYGLRRAAHDGNYSSNVSTNNPNAKTAARNAASLLIALPFIRKSVGKDLGNKLATAAGASYILTAAYKHFKHKPKNIIEKAIIKLRRVYNSWMIKANDARVTGQGNVFKNAASVVLKIIDKLLELVQKGAHKIG